MSDSELPPLPDDIGALLRSAEPPAPPVGFDARVLGRIKGTLGGPGAGGGDGGPSPSGSPMAAAGGVAAKMGAWGIPISVAALVIGASGGMWVGARLSTPAPASVAVVAEAPPPAPIPTIVAVEAMPPPPAVSEPPRPTVVKKKVEPPPSRDVELAEERALLEVARTALVRSETTRSLDTLAEHARRFPKGQLIEERDSLWVQALVNAGRLDEAKLRAAEFRAAFADSMLLPAVDAALRARDGG